MTVFPILLVQIGFFLVTCHRFDPPSFPQMRTLPSIAPSASSGIARTDSLFDYTRRDDPDYPEEPTFKVVQPDFGVPRISMPYIPPPRTAPSAPQPSFPVAPPRIPVAPAVPVEPVPEISEIPEDYQPVPEESVPTSGKPAEKSSSYEINYCDKVEFSDEVLGSYGLERLDYFIWNTTCSDIFFQCSIGETFLLKCTSPDQAFDRATGNCNFRNAVKVCPDYDHVMHCSIKETCTEQEYACCSLPQQCLSLSKRCDGHADCSDGDDENNCPSCAKDEFACVKSGACIKAEKRCDGVADDCGDGSNTDEIGCSRNSTCVGKFMCGESREGLSCIDWERHCDGTKDCFMGEDELNCRTQSETGKYLLCENQKQSVQKQQWCDGRSDCADGSDEKYCY